MIDTIKNFAVANVATGYDASATTVVLETGKGARFPSVGSTGGFNAVWWNVSDYGDPSEDPNAEVVRITARSSDTLTVVRAQEGTSASTKNTSGKTYRMVCSVTAKTFNTDLQRVEMCVAVSDETTALTTGAAKVTMRMPFAMTLTGVRASVNTASSSGAPAVDINEEGTSVLSTKLTIDAGEKTSLTAAAAAVISDAALADDAEITIDIDTAGTGAKGLKVWLIGTRA